MTHSTFNEARDQVSVNLDDLGAERVSTVGGSSVASSSVLSMSGTDRDSRVTRSVANPKTST